MQSELASFKLERRGLISKIHGIKFSINNRYSNDNVDKKAVSELYECKRKLESDVSSLDERANILGSEVEALKAERQMEKERAAKARLETLAYIERQRIEGKKIQSQIKALKLGGRVGLGITGISDAIDYINSMGADLDCKHLKEMLYKVKLDLKAG